MAVYENLSKLSKIKYIDIHNVKARELLKTDDYCLKYYDFIYKYKNGEIAIDTSNDKLVGHVFVGNNSKDPGFISSLEVKPEYRRLGIATKMLKDAINKYHRYDLTVRKNNTIAINMYKNFGFKINDEGSSEDMYYMVYGKEK